MLANLLPGLRHVRTPLATGYLYLLAAWLWFGDDVADISNDALDRLSELSAAAGISATLAAVSFAAYLIGSILTWKNPFGLVMFTGNERRDDRPSHPVYPERIPRDWASGLRAWAQQTVDQMDVRTTYADIEDQQRLPSALSKSIRGAFNDDRETQFTAVRALTLATFVPNINAHTGEVTTSRAGALPRKDFERVRRSGASPRAQRRTQRGRS